MAYTTIDDPSAYFHTQLYTGNGASTRAITNDANAGNFKPDWLWIKQRSQASRSHSQWDSSRGASERLQSDITGAEETQTNDHKSFDTDGFTVGSGNIVNENSQTFVAWQWKANGGTTSSNTSGDITTTVQANTTAGFSIATYTGNGGSDQTLGHGLGAEPDFVIFKDRDSSSAWRVYTKMTGASKFLNLNTTDAANTSSNIFPSVSSTVIGVEQNDVMNKNSSNHVMYSFRSIQGYSKIGSYTGNGNADGPFIYTGFKPAWIMLKSTENAQVWSIRDNKMDTFNPAKIAIYANESGAQSDHVNNSIDLVSNGFKFRNQFGTENNSSETFIYMAFAEHPFVSSKGVPVTAR